MKTAEWAGVTGDTWAEEWRVTDRSFGGLDEALVAAIVGQAEGQAAPRILDVGCGAGSTSLAVAKVLPEARITGVDVSPALVAAAGQRAREANAGDRCRFVAADASGWADEDGFDLVVSRHGVMFFDDPAAAFAHLHDLAKPGGALVFSCFRAASLNPWASGIAALMPPPSAPPPPFAPSPFAFADPAAVTVLLEAAGWHAPAAHAFDYRYVAGTGEDPVADAMRFFSRISPAATAMAKLEGEEKARFRAGLLAMVEANHKGDDVAFPAAAWIWSAQT